MIVLYVNFFVLDTPPKSLDEDIVKNTTSSVPTDGNVRSFKTIGKSLGSELTSLVGVENFRFSVSKCLFQSRKTEENVLRIAKFPRQHITRESIDYGTKINIATDDRDKSDIC